MSFVIPTERVSAKEHESRKPYWRENACKNANAVRSRLMKPLLRLVAALATLTLCAHGQAQQSTAEVHGVITDVHSARIAGATLSFDRSGTRVAQVVQTSEDGVYRAALPPGFYRLTVKAQGFHEPKAIYLRLAAGESRELSLWLEAGIIDKEDIPGEKPQREPLATPGLSVLAFVAPPYPAIARTARVQGAVRLLVDIRKTGEVEKITAVSGHPMLEWAAAEAVSQWRFGCQRCDEKLRHIVTIKFEIDDALPGQCYPKREALRCVEPDLPNGLTVRAGPVFVETMSQTRDPSRSTVDRVAYWPSPWVFGGTNARPNPVHD